MEAGENAAVRLRLTTSLDGPGRIGPYPSQGGAGGRCSLHMLMQVHPGVAPGIVVSEAGLSRLPQQKLAFVPLYSTPLLLPEPISTSKSHARPSARGDHAPGPACPATTPPPTHGTTNGVELPLRPSPHLEAGVDHLPQFGHASAITPTSRPVSLSSIRASIARSRASWSSAPKPSSTKMVRRRVRARS